MTRDANSAEARAARLEKLYRTPDVVAQRCETLRLLDLKRGERVLDVGAGPGLLTFDMAELVGPSGRVDGIDLSDELLAMSRERCADQDWVSLRSADATDLPFDDGAFDAVVAVQVYEYVADIAKAFAELSRVSRPGGRTLLIDTDFDSLVLNTTDDARHRRILAAWDEHLVHRALPRATTPALREAGFEVIQRGTIPIFNTEYTPHCFGWGICQIMAAFTAGRRGVTEADAEAWLADLEALGDAGAFFFSLNRYYVLARKPG